MRVLKTFRQITSPGSIACIHHFRPQIMEGTKLVESTVVSDDDDNKEAFLTLTEFDYSSILDDDNNAKLECYLNLLEIPDHVQNPLSFACMCKQQQQDQ